MVGRWIAWMASLVLPALLAAPAAGGVPAVASSLDVPALRQLLIERDYPALDAVFARFRGSSNLSRAFATSDPDLAAALDAWVNARPASPGARLARGQHLAQLARLVAPATPDSDGADGRARSKRQYLAAAARDFETAIVTDETLAAAWAGLIRVRLAQGDRAGAERAFRAAAAKAPGAAAPYLAFAEGLSPDAGGSLARLDAFAARALEAEPGVDLRWYADYWRGVALLRQGKDTEGGLALLARAAAAHDDPVVHAELAAARWYAGRKDEAYAGLSTFLATRPFDRVALTRLCQLLISDRRIAAARATCERTRRLDPLAPGLLVRLSYLERQTRDRAGAPVAPDDARAKRYLELANAYGSHDAWVQRARARYYAELPAGSAEAETVEARRIAAAAMLARLAPDDPEARSLLSDAYLAAGRCSYIAASAAYLSLCQRNGACGRDAVERRTRAVERITRTQQCDATEPHPFAAIAEAFAGHSNVRTMSVAGIRLAMNQRQLAHSVPGLDLVPRLRRGVTDGFEVRRHALPTGVVLDVFAGRDGDAISIAAEEHVAETDLAKLRALILRHYGPPDQRTDNELRYRQTDRDGRLLAELRITLGRPNAYLDPEGCGVPHALVRWSLVDFERQTRNMRDYMAALVKHAATTGSLPPIALRAAARPEAGPEAPRQSECASVEEARLATR